MSTNDFLFGVLPYVVGILAIVVSLIRWRRHPFSVSSLSSQLLESRRLYWGSVPFHWGISLILLGHLAVLFVPSGFELWNGSQIRLYLLEITGLALALWAAVGIVVLAYRRLTSSKVLAVTSPMDAVVIAIVGLQIATGIWIAIGYRWGSFWGTSVFVPYIWSLVKLQPRPEFIDPLPFILQAHVFLFWVFLAVFPFTRLVHIISLPLGYLIRPWQKVIRMNPEPSAYHGAADKPMERTHR